jgi:hypothetical protein
MAAKSLGSPALKFVSIEVLDALLNIFLFLLKDRYLRINNICGKNNNKGVEYRHDKKKYFDKKKSNLIHKNCI